MAVHLRPVPNYYAKNPRGTVHVITSRSFSGKHELSACGHKSTRFQRVDEENVDSVCKRCKQIVNDNE